MKRVDQRTNGLVHVAKNQFVGPAYLERGYSPAYLLEHNRFLLPERDYEVRSHHRGFLPLTRFVES